MLVLRQGCMDEFSMKKEIPLAFLISYANILAQLIILRCITLQYKEIQQIDSLIATDLRQAGF